MTYKVHKQGDRLFISRSKLTDASQVKFDGVMIEKTESAYLRPYKGKKFTDINMFNKVLRSADWQHNQDNIRGYDKVFLDWIIKYEGHTYKFHYGRIDIGDSGNNVALTQGAITEVLRTFTQRVGTNKGEFTITQLDSCDIDDGSVKEQMQERALKELPKLEAEESKLEKEIDKKEDQGISTKSLHMQLDRVRKQISELSKFDIR